MRAKAPRHRHKPRPWRAPTHCEIIRSLPCLLTGRPAECVHIRFSDASHGKTETGMQRRDDRWTVPLCPELHRLLKGCQHDSEERAWWKQFRIDPLAVAKMLWGRSRLEMERAIIMSQPWDEDVKARVRAILKGAK